MILPGKSDIAKCICCAKVVSKGNLGARRRSLIWFVLAFVWALDCMVAVTRRNWLQAALTAFFAACFLAIGCLYRGKERKAARTP